MASEAPPGGVGAQSLGPPMDQGKSDGVQGQASPLAPRGGTGFQAVRLASGNQPPARGYRLGGYQEAARASAWSWISSAVQRPMMVLPMVWQGSSAMVSLSTTMVCAARSSAMSSGVQVPMTWPSM